jgi:uncharacterized RDD family membrane protein YckC
MTGFERSRADTALGVQTPEGIEFIIYPAGLPIRACAWVIDGLIQGFFLLAIIIVMGLMSEALGVWFLLIILFALDWFYHTAFEVFCKGQSPGKRVMKIRVVRGDGSPVNPGASFLRNLLRIADSFMFLYLIVFICMLVSPGFRRLGDWAADTLVVYTEYARSPVKIGSFNNRVPQLLADFPMVFPSRKLVYEEKQALLMFARRYPLLGKARSDEIAGIWVPKLQEGQAPESEGDSAYLLGIARTLS